jgi:hypothetical protein
MTFTQVFNVSSSGTYPLEKYSVTPITFTQQTLPKDFTSVFWNQLDGSGQSVQTGGSLISRDYLNYHKTPLNNVISDLDAEYNNIIVYENINYVKFSDKFLVNYLTDQTSTTRFVESVPIVTISNAQSNFSSIYFNTDTLRQSYKTPYEFYFFYIQLNDISKNSYGYIIYPTKLFLRPISVTNNNNKWQLRTQVGVLSTEVFHFQSETIESDVFKFHDNRLNTPNYNYQRLPSNLNTHKLYFYLYGAITKVNEPIVIPPTFSLAPNLCSIFLESDTAYIHPDSTFVAYSAIYLNNLGQRYSLAQETVNSNYLYESQNFSPTFLLKYNQTDLNRQIYQLVQDPINPSFPLYGTQNAILSSTFELNNGRFQFLNYYSPARVTFNPQFPLKVNYIADCYRLKTLNISASSTLTSQQLTLDQNGSQTNRSILNSFNVSEVNGENDFIVWETQYPPYCYSYKVDLDNSGDVYMDHNHLTFYLKLSTLNQSANVLQLSTIITTDFNTLVLPILPTYSIRFSIESTSLENDELFLDAINCVYGSGQNAVVYDIKNPTFIPVGNNSAFTIFYEDLAYQGVSFVIKATLITDSGVLDTFDPQVINLELPDFGASNKIFLNVINEFSNQILIDASLNNTEESWPARDLSASLIKWSYSGIGNLNLNYIDDLGNNLGPVLNEIEFSDRTARVSLSGYGPTIGIVSLSSQKYNETVSISSNPAFFDFLSLGEIKIGPSKPLNNLNRTRNIELTAAMPYANRFYNIPNTIPFNWTWDYDGITDPTLQPIVAEQPLNNNSNYLYGIDLISPLISAIKLNITPNYSLNSPNIRKVNVTASINIVQPPITGSYSFFVDDFPDPSIFNSDFIVYYKVHNDDNLYIPEPKIADTRNDEDIITRSEKTILNFYLSSYGDTLNNIQIGNIDWYFDNKKTNINNIKTILDLTNPLSGLQPKIMDGLTVSSLKVDLVLNSSLAPNWTSAHNVSATVNFYVLSSDDFYKPLNFINFPQYAWIGEYKNENGVDYYDSTKITFLSTISTFPQNEEFFTNAFTPTAYGNIKTNTYVGWFSANKTYFNQFIYQNTRNFKIKATNKSFDLIEVPYDDNDFFVYAVGIPISLVAYNNSFYKEGIKLNYKDLNYGNITYTDRIHTITARTTSVDPTSGVYDNFFLHPKIRNYNNLSLRYNPLCNGQYTNSLVLDLSATQGSISVIQMIDTVPKYRPAIAVSGTIVYYLSTQYWTASSLVFVSDYVITSPTTRVSGLSTIHDLFLIQYGDPSIPLFAAENGITEFVFYSEPQIIQKIPSSTFDNYSQGFWQYPKDPDLWNGVLLD